MTVLRSQIKSYRVVKQQPDASLRLLKSGNVDQQIHNKATRLIGELHDDAFNCEVVILQVNIFDPHVYVANFQQSLLRLETSP